MFCEVARWQREEGGGKKKTVPQERKKSSNFFCYFQFLQIPVRIYLSLVNILGWSKGGKMEERWVELFWGS